MTFTRKVTIIGGGAIGGIVGAYLTRAALDVTVADRWPEHVEAMREGLLIDGCRGKFKIPLNAVQPKDLKAPFDIVMLAVKSGDTTGALELIKPGLQQGSIVITMQNSINEDQVATAVGLHRTMGCVVGWGASVIKAGHLTQTSRGAFMLGSPGKESEKALLEVQALLSLVDDCHTTDNIYGFRWLKLLANCSISIATLTGKTIGETLTIEEMEPIIYAVISEGLEVAAQAGIKLETLEYKFTPEQYLALKEFIAASIVELLKTEHKNILPAFYLDILKGRKSEIDFINGYIAAKGLEFGVSTPINCKVVEMVHEIEDQKRQVGPGNILQLYSYL
jgi:2-dehydropantoate 2-reductase